MPNRNSRCAGSGAGTPVPERSVTKISVSAARVAGASSDRARPVQ
jgi:hypothetical protein